VGEQAAKTTRAKKVRWTEALVRPSVRT
jgi:hypothetical protein